MSVTIRFLLVWWVGMGKGKDSIILWLNLSVLVQMCPWVVAFVSISQLFLPSGEKERPKGIIWGNDLSPDPIKLWQGLFPGESVYVMEKALNLFYNGYFSLLWQIHGGSFLGNSSQESGWFSGEETHRSLCFLKTLVPRVSHTYYKVVYIHPQIHQNPIV